jgi:hypothetical protein
MTSMEIATIVTAIATAGGVIALAVQIYLQRQEHKRETITRLFGEINTPGFRKALRFVYSCDGAQLTLDQLPPKRRDQVEMVTAHLDRLGFRLEKGLVPKDESYDLFWDVVLRTAQRLWPHIEDQRKRRDDEHYKEYYEHMIRRFKRRHLHMEGQRLPKKRLARLATSELLGIEPLKIFVLPSEEEDELAYLRQRVADLEARLTERDGGNADDD